MKIFDFQRFESIVEQMDLVSRVPADLITNLIALGKIEMRYAVFNNELFHAKYGLIKDGNDGIAISGSINHSQNAMERQYENFNVFRSWNNRIYDKI